MPAMEIGSPEHKQWLEELPREDRYEAETPLFAPPRGVERRKGDRNAITAPSAFAVLDAIEREHGADMQAIDAAIFDASCRAGEMSLETIGRSHDVWISWHALARELTVASSALHRWGRL